MMPAQGEPSNFEYPQKPFNKIYFPKSKSNAGLHARSNPYACTFGNIDFLGTSGENIKDMIKQAPYH